MVALHNMSVALFVLLLCLAAAAALVSSQTPEEMLKYVRNASSTLLDFRCLPHGFRLGGMRDNASSQELLDEGIQGLYKWAKITDKCDGIMDENNRTIDSPEKRMACFSHCAMEELGIFATPWSQSLTTLGNFDLAVKQFEDLLTAKLLLPGQRPMSRELMAEVVVRNAFVVGTNELAVRARLNINNFSNPLSCHLNSEEYWGVIFNMIRWMVVLGIDNCEQIGLPVDPLSGELNMDYVEVHPEAPMDWEEWPGVSCFLSKPPPAALQQERNTTGKDWLKRINGGCRNRYYMTRLKIDFEENSPETCTKLCILEELDLLDDSTGVDLEDIKVGIFDKRFHMVTEGFVDEDSENGSYTPVWRDEDTLKRARAMINNSLIAHQLAKGGGAECVKASLWAPVLEEVETFFRNECGDRQKDCKKKKKKESTSIVSSHWWWWWWPQGW